MNEDKCIQHLEFNEVIRAAREYFDAGMLTAQAPHRDHRSCINAGQQGRRCAVAAGFSVALLAKCPDGTIGSNIESGYVTVDNRNALIMLQRLHDFWANEAAKVGDLDPDNQYSEGEKKQAYRVQGMRDMFEHILDGSYRT